VLKLEYSYISLFSTIPHTCSILVETTFEVFFYNFYKVYEWAPFVEKKKNEELEGIILCGYENDFIYFLWI